MIGPFDYKIPKSLGAACDILWDNRKSGWPAKVIAGGTDLVIGLRKEELRPGCLVDVTGIRELRRIEEKEGMIIIGAAVTHSEIASSPVLKKYGAVLAEAASWVGSPQIRNLGTLGGNIVNASPSADTIPSLMVLNATARVVSKKGEREVPLSELFVGPYESSLKPCEILMQVQFPRLPEGAKFSFIRLARREAMAISRMSIAAIVQMKKELIEDLRVSVGAVTPTPQRMVEAETLLIGSSAEEEKLRLAAQEISKRMIRFSGPRPSTAYKKPVIEALFMRAVRNALQG